MKKFTLFGVLLLFGFLLAGPAALAQDPQQEPAPEPQQEPQQEPYPEQEEAEVPEGEEQEAAEMATGELLDVNAEDSTFTIKDEAGEERTFSYDDGTKITGAETTTEGLAGRTGSRVTVHYESRLLRSDLAKEINIHEGEGIEQPEAPAEEFPPADEPAPAEPGQPGPDEPAPVEPVEPRL